MEKTLTLGSVIMKADGIELAMDLSKMHESWLVRIVEYGARRLVNDTYSGEKGAEKVECCRAMIAEMENGAPMPQRERKAASASKADPVRKLARDLATTFLTQSLAARLGKDMSVWAAQDSLKALFTFTEKGNAKFDLGGVDKWMASYTAKRDFMAEAQEQIAKAQSAGADLDLSDLGL